MLTPSERISGRLFVRLKKWLVTFSKKTQILKDLKVQKHLKTTFRRIRLNVPGFVDPVIRSARISGRLFVRLKIGYLHFFNQKLQILKHLKSKLKNPKMSKKHLLSSNLIIICLSLAFITPLGVSKLNFAADRGILNPPLFFHI